MRRKSILSYGITQFLLGLAFVACVAFVGWSVYINR